MNPFECRFCGTGELFAANVRWAERPLRWFGLAPHQCDACDKRSYRFVSPPRHQRERDVAGAEELRRVVDLLAALALGREKTR